MMKILYFFLLFAFIFTFCNKPNFSDENYKMIYQDFKMDIEKVAKKVEKDFGSSGSKYNSIKKLNLNLNYENQLISVRAKIVYTPDVIEARYFEDSIINKLKISDNINFLLSNYIKQGDYYVLSPKLDFNTKNRLTNILNFAHFSDRIDYFKDKDISSFHYDESILKKQSLYYEYIYLNDDLINLSNSYFVSTTDYKIDEWIMNFGVANKSNNDSFIQFKKILNVGKLYLVVVINFIQK